MICNKCNHTLPDDSEFCQYCGTEIFQEKEEISNDVKEENHETIKALASENKPSPEQPVIDKFKETPDSKSRKKRSTKFKLLLISGIALTSCLAIIVTALLGTYFFGPSKLTDKEIAAKAENAVAVYLSKQSRYPRFVSFQNTYYTITKSKTKYTVELGGGAQNSSERIVAFNATVEIVLSSGEAIVRKVCFDGNRLL